MIVKTKDLFLESTIVEFAQEIHQNHISYLDDYDFAYIRAKEILEDIQENGLKMEKIPSFYQPNDISVLELNRYDSICLRYEFGFFGSTLYWELIY